MLRLELQDDSLNHKMDTHWPSFQMLFYWLENNIYNQSFLKSKDWRKFKKRMLKLSSDINDDLELQIAFSAFARDFPFSHYYLYKSQPELRLDVLKMVRKQ